MIVVQVRQEDLRYLAWIHPRLIEPLHHAATRIKKQPLPACFDQGGITKPGRIDLGPARSDQDDPHMLVGRLSKKWRGRSDGNQSRNCARRKSSSHYASSYFRVYHQSHLLRKSRTPNRHAQRPEGEQREPPVPLKREVGQRVITRSPGPSAARAIPGSSARSPSPS